MAEPWEDPGFSKFARAVRDELAPKLDGSAIVMSLVPRATTDIDVKYAVELGLSILLDKPICLLVHPGQVLPEHLVRVADNIVEVDLANPSEAAQKVQNVMAEMMDPDA